VNMGYQDCGGLHPVAIQDSLTGGRIRGPIVLYDSLGSTNDVAMKMVSDHCPEGMVIIADSQREGKGRMERRWFSVRGRSVVFSVITRPSSSLIGFTLMCGLSVVDALNEVSKGLMIKWPNDIYAQGKKLGGILSEASRGMVVAGIGINVNEDRVDFNPEIKDTAISLNILNGSKLDRKRIICMIINKLDTFYQKWEREGFSALKNDVQSKMAYMGRSVKFQTNDQCIEGKVNGIDEKGYLEMDVDGRRRYFSTGDLII
jgi:BirA family biotin operon repressor/biotin-[acetyl-CoA-carboxylase] ligase